MTVNKITSPISAKELIDKTNEIIDNLGVADTLIPVTYSELVTLKTGGNLQEGAFYRITDYVTTSNGNAANGAETGAPVEPSRSAAHQFDIIIQAVGSSNLAEEGTCAIHGSDTYFQGQNLGAWRIWYDIENNTNKYGWADTTNGKGVIYRMIDEKGNDCPYDFKNIQFYRDDSLSRYSTISSYLTASDDYYYTFSVVTDGTCADFTISDFAKAYGGNNVIKPTSHSNNEGTIGVQDLNNNVFVATAAANRSYNEIGSGCYSNTFAGACYNNRIAGASSYSNVVGNNFFYNEIGNLFRNNVLGVDFKYNRIAGAFYGNSITCSGGFDHNDIGFTCSGNTITGSGALYNNVMGCAFQNNVITAKWIYYNTFGNQFANHTINAGSTGMSYCDFGNGVQKFTIGDNCKNITVQDNCGLITIGSGVQNVFIKSAAGRINIPASTKNMTIESGIVGSSNTNLLDLTGLPTSQSYNITVSQDAGSQIIAAWKKGAIDVGKYKTSVTASSWSDLTTTVTVSSWEA